MVIISYRLGIKYRTHIWDGSSFVYRNLTRTACSFSLHPLLQINVHF